MRTSDKEPRIIYQGGEYLVLYKPPLMHSASLLPDERGTLSAWCAEHFPQFLSVRGKKAVEGGLLHRLDYETGGLVFAALTQPVFDAMLRQQEEGLFVKDYEAIACKKDHGLPGFPPRPPVPPFPVHGEGDGGESRFRLESGFRCYGAGKKAVRPVSPCSKSGRPAVYQTEILGVEMTGEALWRVSLRLARGFRHQIRCHLSWLGFPILGDLLYGGKASASPLALRAVGLSFFDPPSGAPTRLSLSVKNGGAMLL
ncbi:MAG: RNA pseudouridine synthase [Spirochaetaceae bacterium]|jgi:23S rRNA pseudouridine1911/1915/1917 synthase|nr:RNA pseudouridine synthase [Spirochaetaceae bacterium]